MIHGLPIEDQCLRAAWELGLVQDEKSNNRANSVLNIVETGSIIGETGMVTRCNPFGASAEVWIQPNQRWITPASVHLAVQKIPQGASLEIATFPCAGDGTSGMHITHVVAAFGVLPYLQTGFVEVFTLEGQVRAEVVHGKGRLRLGYDESSGSAEDSMFFASLFDWIYGDVQTFLEVSLWDVIAPVIIDRATAYLPFRNAPKFYEEAEFNTYRCVLPRDLGLGLAFVLRLEFSSATELYKRLLPTLRHYACRVMFARAEAPTSPPASLFASTFAPPHSSILELQAAFRRSVRELCDF
eukprot:g1874.t1